MRIWIVLILCLGAVTQVKVLTSAADIETALQVKGVPLPTKVISIDEAAPSSILIVFNRSSSPAVNPNPKNITLAPTPTVDPCKDVPPDAEYTCEQQASYGRCDAPYMQGYCKLSCKRCTSPTPISNFSDSSEVDPDLEEPAPCEDVPPDAEYTCEQQVSFDFGRCDAPYMKGYCNLSCKRCTSATPVSNSSDFSEVDPDLEEPSPSATPTPKFTPCKDVPPNAEYTCEEQASFKRCGAPFMKGYCNLSCKRCSSPSSQPSPSPSPSPSPLPEVGPNPEDISPTPTPTPCEDVPPNAEYTCEEQASFKRCGAPFMKGYCNLSCKRCP